METIQSQNQAVSALRFPPRSNVLVFESLKALRPEYEELSGTKGILNEFERDQGRYGCQVIDTLLEIIDPAIRLTQSEWALVNRALSSSVNNEADHRVGSSGWLNHSIMEIAVFIRSCQAK